MATLQPGLIGSFVTYEVGSSDASLTDNESDTTISLDVFDIDEIISELIQVQQNFQENFTVNFISEEKNEKG